MVCIFEHINAMRQNRVYNAKAVCVCVCVSVCVCVAMCRWSKALRLSFTEDGPRNHAARASTGRAACSRLHREDRGLHVLSVVLPLLVAFYDRQRLPRDYSTSVAVLAKINNFTNAFHNKDDQRSVSIHSLPAGEMPKVNFSPFYILVNIWPRQLQHQNITTDEK